MAFDPFKAVGDMFSGETVKPYKADKSAFNYYGDTEADFHKKIGGQSKYTQADLGQYNESRALGGQSRDQLQTQINSMGNMPSVGAAQLKAGQAQNFQQAIALSRAGGGAAQQAAAMRGAMQTNTAANANTNLQAAVVSAQEQRDMQALRSNMMMQQRAMDLQAQGLDAQTALSQAQLELGSRQLSSQYDLGLMGLGQNSALATQKGGIAYEGMQSGNYMASQIANANSDAARDSAILGLGAVVGGGLIASSDVRSKMDVVPVGDSPTAEPFSLVGPRPAPARATQIAQPAPLAAPVAPVEDEDERKRRDFGGNVMGAGMDMIAAGARGTGLEPTSYLNYGQVPSDARAKELEGENRGLRAALAAVAPQPRAMQRGAVRPPDLLDRRRAAVNDEVSAAEYGKAWTEANAADAQRDYKGATRFMLDEERARNQLALAQARAAEQMEGRGRSLDLMQRRSAAFPGAIPEDARNAEIARQQAQFGSRYVGDIDTVPSDKHAKDAVEDFRRAFANLDLSRSPEADAFIETARAKLGTDPEQAIRDSLAVANLDDFDRETAPRRPAEGEDRITPRDRPSSAREEFAAAFRDAGMGGRSQAADDFIGSANDRLAGKEPPPPLRGGDTSVARFDDAHPAASQIASVPAYGFRYKPEAQSAYGVDGRPRMGVMAQDLEQVPATAATVGTDPRTGYKVVDAGQLTMTNTAILSDLARLAQEQEDRLSRIEARRSMAPYGVKRGTGGL